MGSMDEILPGAIRPPSNIQVTGGRRRALSTIDKNIVGAPPYHVNKRGAAGNFKPPVIPVHRPVTRKFAAQIDGKEKPRSILEVRPAIQAVPIAHQSEDCIIIDADHACVAQMPKETDQMDTEVEMEDVEVEPIVDIDSCDKSNPLAVTEYIDDLYAYYKKRESLSCIPPNYMVQQFDINERMRGILIDWLIEVHYKFELMDETLYLAVNLIDRFLAVQTVPRKKLQLVGVTALLLACKYEEVSVPIVEDLIIITDRAYCRKELLEMEKLMINKLQFNLSLPTPYVFMRRFLKAAQSDKRMELLSYYIIELCLVEYEMLRFPPSLLAAAAVFTAQCFLSGCKQWSETCRRHTGYMQEELLECAKLMMSFLEKAGSGRLTGVYKKYSTSKYGYVAQVQPPLH